MPEQQHTDGDELTNSDLDTLHNVVANANRDVGDAVAAMVGYADHSHPEMAVERTHGELIDAYASITTAIDRAEVQLDNAEYGADTPRQITREHAERIKETYDRPIVDLALMLLEANRREWLHGKPDTNGADEVRRHGLTTNQRKFLNTLQRRGRESDIDHEAVEEQLSNLRADAAEVRGSGECEGAEMAEQIEQHVDGLEAALGGVDRVE